MVSLEPQTAMVQSGIMNFFAYAGCRDMQFSEKFSNIENHLLYRLNAEPALEPRSTFCISERYIAGLKQRS